MTIQKQFFIFLEQTYHEPTREMHFLGSAGGELLKAAKSSLLYATICPSKLIHMETSNRVLMGESNTA